MDKSEHNELPLISEEPPGRFRKAISRVFSSEKAKNKKAKGSRPLISEASVDYLNAQYPQRYAGDLVTNLDGLFADQEFINYILQSNTFFHGRIGFYRYIIDKIRELSGILADEKDYIHTQKGLNSVGAPPDQKQKPLILLPITETDDAFNSLVANSFEKSQFVWLIAPPAVLRSHLLVAFNNFFLSSSTSSELEHLQSIFRLSDATIEMLDDGTYKGIVVTDYKPLAINTAIVIRLQNL